MLCFPGPGQIEETWGMYSSATVGVFPGFPSTGLKMRNPGHHLAVSAHTAFAFPGLNTKANSESGKHTSLPREGVSIFWGYLLFGYVLAPLTQSTYPERKATGRK